MAPDIHELVGRQFSQFTALWVAELAHEIGAPVQVDTDVVLQLCRRVLRAVAHLAASVSIIITKAVNQTIPDVTHTHIYIIYTVYAYKP